MRGMSRWLTVEGLNLERLIRRAGEEGIIFKQLGRKGRRMRLLVQEDDLPKLLALAEQGGWACKEGGRFGLGRRMDAFRRRWVLPACAMLCAGGLVLGMQVMWQVEIVGAGSYLADAEAFLSARGIAVPMWKNQVNLATLRDELEWRYPRIAWADCGWRGTTLRISLVEGVPQGESLSISGAGDVVAARGGIVESIITAAGTPQVTSGQVIQPGQVLISGYERGEGDTLRPVMARGRVLARVWDAATVRMSCMEAETSSTGRQQQVWTVQGPLFPLTAPVPSPYETQDVQRIVLPLGGLFFPFHLVMETRFEVEIQPRMRDIKEVQAEAGTAALRLLGEEMDFHDDFVDKWVDYCMIEGEVVEAVAYGERLMDVALPRRSQ